MPKKIVFSDDTQIVYTEPKSSLDNTWDSLSSYYQQKATEYQSEHMSKQSMVTKFLTARVELETISTTFKLIKENVVSCINIDSKTDNKINLTNKIVEDALKIINHKLEMLLITKKKEEMLFKTVEKYNCTVDNGVLKIILDNNYYVVVEGNKYLYPEKWKPTGLRCTIEFRGLKYTGMKQCKNNLDEMERLVEYVTERKIIGNFIKEGIKISIEECEDISGGNEVCLLIIEKLKNGTEISLIYEIVVCFLSKLTWRGLVTGDYEIINGNGERMIDGLSPEYFLMTEIGVIRVCRYEYGFEIFTNENKLLLPSMETE